MSNRETTLAPIDPGQSQDTQSTALVALPAREMAETNLDYVHRLMEMLPPPADDVIDAIAGKILAAESMYEENMLWDATGSQNAVGRRFIAHSVHVQPSDYEDSPLDYFVVINVTDLSTGEKTVLTSGSVNLAVSFVKAQILGQLPWEFEVAAPKRTPKNGKVPLHVRWVAKVAQAEEVEP